MPITLRKQGQVLWYDPTKGYGVIEGNDKNTYFVHYTNIVDHQNLEEGQSVMFLSKPSDRPGHEGRIDAFEVAPRIEDKKAVLLQGVHIPFDETETIPWENSRILDRFPITKTHLDELCEVFSLDYISVNLKFIRKFDPFVRYFPQNKYCRGTTPTKNGGYQYHNGTFVGLRNDAFTLLLFVFDIRIGSLYDENAPVELCWRAYLMRNSDSGLFNMGQKINYPTYPRHNSYRQGEAGFTHLVSDIRSMTQYARICTQGRFG